MDKLNSLIAAVILTVLVACQKDNSGNTAPNATPLSDTLRIKLGETVNFSNFSIKLDSANDSRCPINAQCFWAGVATAKLNVKKDNATEFARFLLDPTNKNTVDKVTVFNRRLHLLNVLLPPNASNQDDYFIQLIVE
jgi:hypothetical protein